MRRFLSVFQDKIPMFGVCFHAGRLIFQSQYSYRASTLAFATVISIVPILSIIIYLMAHSAFYSKFSELAQAYVVSNFVPKTSSSIIDFLNRFSHQASQLPVVSILFLFFTAVTLVITVHDTMLVIWPRSRKTHGMTRFLVYPAMVLFLPMIAGLCGLLNSILLLMIGYIPWLGMLKFFVPLVINALVLSLLYYFSSSARTRWADALIGAFVAALLFEITKWVFMIYIDKYSNYNAIYGAFSSAPIFLIWIYLFWFIVLYGALIVRLKSGTLTFRTQK